MLHCKRFASLIEVCISSCARGSKLRIQNLTPDVGTVKVASLQKRGEENIIHSNWLFDCIKQDEIDTRGGLPEYLVPLEPR
jgi:hypothetical protein